MVTKRSFVEIKAEIDQLQKEADEALRAERAGVIEEIQHKIGLFGLSVDDVFPKTRARQSRPAKYRDPTTGKSWTGAGRKPQWVAAAIASGQTLDSFLIDRPANPKAKTPAAATGKTAVGEVKAQTASRKGKPAPKAKSSRAAGLPRKTGKPVQARKTKKTTAPAAAITTSIEASETPSVAEGEERTFAPS